MTTEAVDRQLAILTSPPPPIVLARPCTPGDGVSRLIDSDLEGLTGAWHEAATGRRFSKFVPASGAASRMFRDLGWYAESGLEVAAVRERAAAGDRTAANVVRFFESLSELPFAAVLDAPTDGDWPAATERLLARPRGLASLPKGLLPFHRYGDRSRTAFEEHVREGLEILSTDGRSARLHLTVSPEHRGRFEEAAESTARRLADECGVELEIGFSIQDPASSVIALDAEGRPFRDADGRLLLRPGGHGSLLANLGAYGGELVYVKNIDNILPDAGRPLAVQWKQLLGGYLVELRRRIGACLEALDDDRGDRALADGERLLAQALGRRLADAEPETRRLLLRRQLDRPLRICGMVRNEGEPGGGPFWVRAADGRESPQIVESSQVDLDDPEQRRIWESSTHFNPVDLVCALRDFAGRPYELDRFVDPAAVFLTEKSHGGRPLKALEWPGLWNGAMAGWNTVFVEVPGATFAPVKTVFDLLRPAHRQEA